MAGIFDVNKGPENNEEGEKSKVERCQTETETDGVGPRRVRLKGAMKEMGMEGLLRGRKEEEEERERKRE